MIIVPSPEHHARMVSAGLTRYGDYQLIRQASDAFNLAYQEYQSAIEQAAVVFAPLEQYPGWNLYAPVPMQELYNLVCDQPPIPALGSNPRELYPVRKWERYTKQVKQHTSIILNKIKEIQSEQSTN